MAASSPPSAPKVLVIGLDGATWDIARPLMAQGRLPNLARLTADGAAGPLASTVPPISAAAWVTFLTGQNPGRHGVYQFRKMDLRRYGGYRDEFAASHDYRGRSLPERVGQHGRRVAAVGVPMTYPPFPVNGFLVSGFPRPFGPQAPVYPPEMAARLGRWDAMPDAFNFSLSPAKTVEASAYWTRRYTDIALAALAEGIYDLVMVVWNHTDTIPHLYWRYTDPTFPAYDPRGAQRFGRVIAQQYELADAEIGRLLAALPDDNTLVLAMSDHGMGPFPHRRAHLNVWLAEHGWLRLRPAAGRRPHPFNRAVSTVRQRLPTQWRHRLRDRLPASWRARLFARQLDLDRVDWLRTQAYRLAVFPTVEGIVVNLRGRQAQGIVSPGAEYEAVRDAILAGLAALRDPDTGQPIVRRAARREELFAGPHLDEIPDILVELRDSYTGGPALSGPLVTPVPMAELRRHSATHRPDGLFVLHGPGVRRGVWVEGASIADLAPTLLHAMGLPVAADMDGRVLHEALEPAWQRPVVLAEYGLVASGNGHRLSAAEEDAIRRQLAGLGYLS
ncbi:MAG: alkaline phosphatase family protein [Caldilineales bacterium]|nr:alkaline phosphatase family protein [Caldilineales bacterium]